MGSKLQLVLNSPVGVSLALLLGRTVPARFGYRLAEQTALFLATQKKSQMVQSVRLNQWVISRCQLSPTDLDLAVIKTYQHTAKCLYELYHYHRDSEKIMERVELSPRVSEIIQESHDQKNGLILTGVHLSNFDLALHAVGHLGLGGMVIGLADPGRGYKWQNQLRLQAGMEILPGTLSTMREALKLLKNGGLVLTGMDRPVNQPRYKPHFFGLPANLPVHHIHLALQARVPMVVVGTIMQPNGKFYIKSSEPLQMKPMGDRSRETLYNAEAVLEIAEDWISQYPHQWAMFYQVWPDQALPPQ